MPRVLCCIPDHDFDPTEAATPWHHLTEAGVQVAFATEESAVGACDPRMLTGPLLGMLGAKPDAIDRYQRMAQSEAFQKPLRWRDVQAAQWDALLLPGGHAPGMKPYLESEALRDVIRDFLRQDKAVAAICHGVLALARTIDPVTGVSVLRDRRVTALTRTLEKAGYYTTSWKLGSYFRTYPEWVQDEVERNLANPQQFDAGAAPWQPFVVRDGRLLTARWPKDAELFAQEFLRLLAERLD